jgi:hypothetical protein
MTGTQAWQYGPLAPVTWYLGFIRAPAQNIADALVKQGRNTGKSVSTVELDGGLAEAVAALAPFTRRYYARKVIISTESEWCAIVNNSAIGFDPRPLVSHLAVELGVLSALVHCAPYESSWSGKKTSRNQATSLELYGPSRDERSSNLLRAISLVQDGPRWHFILDGELQEFEELDHYADASVRSRFTEELLERYCSAVGVRLFDTGFYGSGLLVESSLPDNLGPEALQPVSFEDLRGSSGLQRY